MKRREKYSGDEKCSRSRTLLKAGMLLSIHPKLSLLYRVFSWIMEQRVKRPLFFCTKEYLLIHALGGLYV